MMLIVSCLIILAYMSLLFSMSSVLLWLSILLVPAQGRAVKSVALCRFLVPAEDGLRESVSEAQDRMENV